MTEQLGSYVDDTEGYVIRGAARISGGSIGVTSSSIPYCDLTADAKCDTFLVVNATIPNGGIVVTSANNLFKPEDVGKVYDMYGGGIVGTQSGFITRFLNPAQVEVSVAANHVAANATFVWGTDDTAAVQRWINRSGPHRFSSGFCMITGTVTVPGVSGVTTRRIDGGAGSFWASARLGATHVFNMDIMLGPTLTDLHFNASVGFLGRFITSTTNNETGSNWKMNGCTGFTPNDDGDYLVFLYNALIKMDKCDFNANNKLYNKCVAISSAISQSSAVNCNLIGRVYSNCQQMSYDNCTLGPARLGNNSVNDGSGTSQQTTVVMFKSCYQYSSTRGGTDFPNYESVLVTVNGEGAAGGVMPNVVVESGYVVFGAGAALAQSAMSGNFAASQGSTGATFKGCGFVQSGTSAATTVTLCTSTGGAPPIYFIGCTANIIAAVVVAKIFVAAAGSGDCVVTDYMPSGQAVPWQHPTTATITPAIGSLAFPASAAIFRNAQPVSYDAYINLNNAVLTKIEISVDGVAFVNIFNDAANVASRALLIQRWSAGVWYRYTYTGGPPNYILIPVL